MDSFRSLAIAFEAAIQAVIEGTSKMCMALAKIISEIDLNRKLTKKKFCKLLQSRGIQRNEINKIIKDNKEPYTVGRLLNIRR